MYKVIGKAHYSVTYEGTVYDKIRYTLELESLPKGYKDCDGILCDVVAIKQTEFNDRPEIGDTVNVSYNRYGKPDVIMVL